MASQSTASLRSWLSNQSVAFWAKNSRLQLFLVWEAGKILVVECSLSHHQPRRTNTALIMINTYYLLHGQNSYFLHNHILYSNFGILSKLYRLSSYNLHRYYTRKTFNATELFVWDVNYIILCHVLRPNIMWCRKSVY